MRLYRKRKKNGTFVWWASWTEDKVTVRRSTGASNREAAELVVARWERERADPVYAAAQSATFGEEARLFMTDCRTAVLTGRLADETLNMYRQKAGSLVRVLGAELRLIEIDGETFGKYLDTRREEALAERGKSIAESTLYKEWVTFRGIMTRAWRGERFGRDPASLRPKHFGPEYTPKEVHLTWEQASALLEELEGDRRRTVAFVLATGARRREWMRAQSGDVKPKHRVHLRGTKTEKSERTIPIPSLMHPWLEIAGEPPFPAWGNSRRALAAAAVRINHRAWVAWEEGGKKGPEPAPLPAVTWNDLRRTFASLLVQAGVPPHLVAKLLGHTTTAMVDRVYGRQTAESIEALVEGSLRPRRDPKP
jgi:integrase